MSLFQPSDDKLFYTAQWDDDNRLAFVQNLDESDVVVTKWEAEFIESALQNASKYEHPRFTPKQRSVIEKLYTAYNDSID